MNIQKFESPEEALAAARNFVALRDAGKHVTTTGNYSVPQIIEHLARSIDIGLGEQSVPKVSWLVSMMAKMMKKRFLVKGMKPGFRLPAETQSLFWPEEEVDAQSALDHYSESISKLMTAEEPIQHPYFGAMTRKEQAILHCRHAELHFSFISPKFAIS